MKISLRHPALPALFLTCGSLSAADYQGANACLKKVASLFAPTASKSTADSAEAIATDLNAYVAAQANLSAEEAGQQWLALLNRHLAVGTGYYATRSTDFRLSFRDFVEAIPGPASWKSIAARIAAEVPQTQREEVRKIALLTFFHRLLGDTSALAQDYEEMQKFLNGLPQDSLRQIQPFIENVLEQMEQDIFALSDEGSVVTRILTYNLGRKVKAATDAARNRYSNFELPDLVTLIGPDQAATFLKKVLNELPEAIKPEHAYKTKVMARELALENVATLKAPQWPLTQTSQGGPLYAALLGKFGEVPSDSEFRKAQVYELLRLLLAGKTSEAVTLARLITIDNPTALPYRAIEEIENAGRTEEVSDFFHGLLAQTPNLPYWPDYVVAAVRSGKTKEMMDLLRTSLLRRDLTPDVTFELERQYGAALLAVGQVEEGVAELAKVAANRRAPLSNGYTSTLDAPTAALHIARIGLLLNNTQWIDQGISLAKEALRKEPEEQNSYGYQRNILDFSKLLLDLDRGPEAEKVLGEALVKLSGPIKEYDYSRADATTSVLCAMVGVYSAAGKNEDVLALLKGSKGWGASDLSQIVEKKCYLGKRREDSLGGCVARALMALGQPDKARAILSALLPADSANDRTYELLLTLDQPNALSILDQQYALDRFQERPLIWKAKVLLDEGKLDEAEKVARQAIAIDPSDGEEGPGDRMRVYVILADILEAKGQAAEAKMFRGVVKSIRLSEDADQYYAAGLLSKAIAMYEESLTYFSDAYCIQSRLALRLSEAGDWKGAEEHYRRAYELMPDSFGRVESHCFGCERAFAGVRQQTLAERVFTKIAAERPTNPQVHYLLGYLRYEQHRYDEALVAFQKATALDPDYLNAWKKILAVGGEMHLPASLRNAVALNILRLDPLGKHSSLDLRGVTDLAGVWNTLAAQNQEIPAVPGDIFPLTASAASVETLKKDSSQRWAYQALVNGLSRTQKSRSPSAIIAKQSFSSNAENFMQAAQGFLK